MFKKFSSGILIVVLIVLLGVYFMVRFAGTKDRTFRDKVAEFDPALVSEVMINTPDPNLDVTLKLKEGNWLVVKKGVEYPADSSMISGTIRMLSDMPTKRYAGKGQDAMTKYELTDSAATRIVLKAGNKELADLMLGKFSYTMPKGSGQQMQMQRQQGEMTTFVRLADEKEVYAVDGFLKMSLGRGADAFRVRTLTSVDPNDINRLTINNEGQMTRLELFEGKWMANGQPADSTEASRYRSTLARLSGSKFEDETTAAVDPSHILILEGNNFNPVELRAFPVADTNIRYLVTSSANPGAFFNGKEGGLFDRIWGGAGF